MGEHATPTSTPSLCRVCSYDLRGTKTLRCPECGSDQWPWSSWWHPWLLCSGLSLLVWGLPLVLAGIVASAVHRADEPFLRIEVINHITFAACILPVLMCLIGVAFVRASQTARPSSVIPITFLVLTGAAYMIAFDAGISRHWVGTDANGVIVLNSTWRAVVSVAFLLIGGASSVAMLSASLVRLSRELGAPTISLTLIAAILVCASLIVAIGADIWAVLAASASPPTFRGTTTRLTFRSTSVTGIDPYTRAAAGLGLSLLWGSVVAIRSRVRWELRNV